MILNKKCSYCKDGIMDMAGILVACEKCAGTGIDKSTLQVSLTRFFKSSIYLILIPIRWFLFMFVFWATSWIQEQQSGMPIFDTYFFHAAILLLIPVFLMQAKSVMHHDRLEDLILHIVLFFAYPVHIAINLIIHDGSMAWLEAWPAATSVFCGYLCVRRFFKNV